MKKDLMKDALEEKKKKALAVTIVIPMSKDEDDDKESKELDMAPALDEEKKEFVKGADRELMKKKKSGGRLSLHEKAMLEAMDEKD